MNNMAMNLIDPNFHNITDFSPFKRIKTNHEIQGPYPEDPLRKQYYNLTSGLNCVVPPYIPVQNVWFNPAEMMVANRFALPTGFDNVFQENILDDPYNQHPIPSNSQQQSNQVAMPPDSIPIPRNEPFNNVPSVSTVFTKRFCLEQQPHEVQRKSYKNENRSLRPNPLVVRAKPADKSLGELPAIVSGVISVKLVNGEGEDLPSSYEERLVCSEGGRLMKAIDEHMTSRFALKLLCTSEGNRFRLSFTVTYTTADGQRHEEKILSLPFVVSSNRRKTQKDSAPVVVDMKPQSGLHNRDTEIWIKGKGFSERVQVMIGNQQATVTETHANLIVATIPARYDIMQDTVLPVIVTNTTKNGASLTSAENKMNFTYRLSMKEEDIF